MRPLLLDLFCGAGGAAVGYHRAGFDVVGVDLHPQPRYPFTFIQADALEYLAGLLASPLRFPYAAIHASPPCQRYSSATRVNGTMDRHPDLVGPMRDLLRTSRVPWVIENVVGAPLLDPALVCGVALDIRLDQYVLRRHRLFESSDGVVGTGCGCHKGDGVTLGVYGGGPTEKARSLKGKNPGGGRPQKANKAQAQAIMGMPWANRTEICEAIPPAYTEWVGAQLIAALRP